MSCKLCLGETKLGTVCKRPASCKIGCKHFCWFHAKKYGGSHTKGSKCMENMSRCKRCNEQGPKRFPCKIKHTIFLTESEYNDYCNMRRARPRRQQPKLTIQEANRLFDIAHQSAMKKKRTSRVRWT